jgi:hypothetical protein
LSDFVERLVADLVAFAPQLMEPGLNPAAAQGIPCNAAEPIQQAQELVRLVPGLIAEAQAGEEERQAVEVTTTRPSRARLSRRAMDYQRHGERVLPRRWVRWVPAAQAQPEALRYLWHQIDARSERLAPVVARRQGWMEEAQRARTGDSSWARDEAVALREMGDSLERVCGALERARGQVLRGVGPRARPRARPPRPFPRGPAWATLRRLLAGWSMPDGLHALRGILSGAPAAADVPFLYQRWCGVKLYQALEDAGLVLERGDPVGAILLGGSITLVHEQARIELWVEPRLACRDDHPSGYRCAGRDQLEATPDYLLVTGGSRGPDAFVLDATKSADEHLLGRKSRYLNEIESAGTRLIAGVPTTQRPLRSWAMAPVGGNHCRLESSDGSRGVIPMQPAHYLDGGLRAWVQDVVDHARAWGG